MNSLAYSKRKGIFVHIIMVGSLHFSERMEPVLNAHNKEEYPPMHTAGFFAPNPPAPFPHPGEGGEEEEARGSFPQESSPGPL